MTVTQAARELHVARVTLSKVLNGQAGISAVMARRLAVWLGTSPDMWVNMQANHDLWQARKVRLPDIKPLRRAA
jgi:addiction module HigA family antidote